MATSLKWVQEAFSREIHLMENGVEVGRLYRAVLERDVEATLHQTHLCFDVRGFLVHSVNIHDLNDNSRIIGTLTFSFGKRAELTLADGTMYAWKRHNMLMRQWDMIRERAADTTGREVVNYSLTRQFLTDHGDIRAELTGPDADIIILTGLFIRTYFQRRQRLLAVGIGGAAVAGF